MKNRKILWELFRVFFKIGLFTFGGGYAMLGVIEENCVDKKGWITHDDMMNVTVIAESTPGPVAINCATFAGYRTAGVAGAVLATLGVVLPSFMIIYIISMFLDRFLEIGVVANAFIGIRIAVGFLVLNTGIKMVKKMKRTPLLMAILIASFTVMMLINIFSWSFSTIFMLLIAGTVGFVAWLIGRNDGKEAGKQ